jgi:glycosyltransferase involved in cell wall biosynthesis
MTRRLFLIFHGRFPSEKAAALFAAKSAEAFAGEGYEVTILAPRRLGRGYNATAHTVYLPTLDLFNLLPHALAFRLSLFIFSTSSYLYLLLRARRTDLIYSNESLPLFFAAFLFPNTVYELHDYPEKSWWLYRSLLARVRGVVVTNRLKAERLATDFPQTGSKVFIEPNAVSLEQFSISATRTEARAALNVPASAKIAVYTGHLYAWKGVDTLAEAARRLGSVAEVYIVGGTDEDLATYKRRYDAVSNLHFIGHRPHAEMPLWQKAADVLVLPNTAREQISAEYTSPMKLFEYMASGTPIIASRLPSIVEIADDSRALLVAPDDPEALARGITEAVGPVGETRAAAARAWVAEHTWDKRSGRILSWINVLPDRTQRFSHERIIFYASLAMSLVFIGIFIASHGVNAPFSTIASDGYLPLASSLYQHGAFTFSTTTPYVLEGAHVPGYPLFLAVTAVPLGNILPTLILQALLFAYSAILLYRLFEGVFSPQIRFFGALIFSIEPYTAFTAVQPLSEALFLLLFIGGLLTLRRAFERERLPLFFAASVLLAYDVLVRPISTYLVPIVFFAVLIVAIVRLPRKIRHIAALMLLGIGLVLLPWAYRNHEAFGTWSLSTKGPYSLYFYDAASVLQYQSGKPATEISTDLVARARARFPEVHTQDDLRSPKYSAFFTSESLAIIKGSPILFAKMYAGSLATFFLSDGYRLLWYEITDGAIMLPNITRAIVTGDRATIATYFETQPVQALLFVLGFVFWASTFFLAVLGGIVGSWSRSTTVRWATLASIFGIAYFALLTGPLAQARYRIVATPFLFMLASYGAALVITRLHAHRRFA